MILQWLMAALYVLAGGNHFLRPDFYLRMMPPYLPWHVPLVYLSGVAEIVLGVLLMIPSCTRWAAWGIIALLIAVFPANIEVFLHQERFPNIGPTLHLLRLPLQALLIYWAYQYTGPRP